MEPNVSSHDEVKVTFRFVGDTVNPTIITSWIGVEPTEAHYKGDIVDKHPHRKHSTGFWGLTSPLSSELPLEEHLRYLVDILELRESDINRLRDTGLSPNFFCGFFTAKTNLGSFLKIESNTLAKIAQLGTALEIHIYYDEDKHDTDFSA